MKYITIVPVLIVALIINVDAGYFSKICKLQDNECIMKTAQEFVPIFAAGVLDLGVENCEPLHIKSIDLSIPSLKLKVSDATIAGLKDAIIKSIRFDEVKNTVQLKLQSTFLLEGIYDMKGKMLFLPIEGKGPVHAKLRKMEITVNGIVKEVVGKDGKTHWQFDYKSHSFALKDKSEVEFEKLFGGDTTLGYAAKELVATSGNEIIDEVGDPVVKAVIDGILARVNAMCAKIPLDELRIN